MNPVLLLAGRRPDPNDAETARFPIENAVVVRERIRMLLVKRRPRQLVCSAACGADLLALDAAGDLGIDRRIVLPFGISAFRESSVTDRPGNWGPLFDRIIAEVDAADGLTVLDHDPGSDDAYTAVNDVLFRLATGTGAPLVAVSVWEGGSRGEGDLTAHLVTTATQAGADIDEVRTL